MFTSFKESDKVWIYTSSVEFTEEQINIIDGYATNFLHAWESHGARVNLTIKILYKRFIAIAADDCDGSMCGRAQDAQVNLIKQLEQELKISLLDRMLLAYRDENKLIRVVSMPEFQKLVESKSVSDETVVFNNMITLVGEFNKWEVPASESWHKQLIS